MYILLQENETVINFRKIKSIDVTDFPKQLLTNYEQMRLQTVLI